MMIHDKKLKIYKIIFYKYWKLMIYKIIFYIIHDEVFMIGRLERIDDDPI